MSIYKITIVSSSSCHATSTDLRNPLSPHSLSSIAPDRSSRLHPVSAQSCCIYVLAGRPTFARSCEGVHRSISLMSSSLLLQQCLPCLSRLAWIVFVMSGRRLYSSCFVGVLPPGLVQYGSQHSCVIAVKLFLRTFS